MLVSLGILLQAISVAVVELVWLSSMTKKLFYMDTNMGEEQPVITLHNVADASCMFLIAYCQ